LQFGVNTAIEVITVTTMGGIGGPRWYIATNRKIGGIGSIPDGVIGIFH